MSFQILGALTKDPHEVFDFIVKLIGQAKRRPGAVSMESLHHCLNRTILFLLSRATDSIADQMAVLEALHKLTTHRYVQVMEGYVYFRQKKKKLNECYDFSIGY